jgi:CubicO group peptidase (beta-lactamase class C family)
MRIASRADNTRAGRRGDKRGADFTGKARIELAKINPQLRDKAKPRSGHLFSAPFLLVFTKKETQMHVGRCTTAICFTLMSLPAAAQDTARMEQVIQYYAGQKLFMGSVLVAKDDKILLDKAYGSANLEWNIPNTPSTKFRLGSLTKQFTATAILLLEERGKLKLDDPISKYIPDAPMAWEKVTIRGLLTHTAGIPNMTAFDNFPEVMRKTLTPQQLIALFRDKPLDFPPGEKWSYSNSGYILLGAVIEKAGGLPYAQFLQENLFTPLGMKDTGYDSAATVLPMRAAGYVRRKGVLVNDEFIDMSIPYAAGALYSTTHDLLAWEKGLYGGKVLKPASLKKMTTPVKADYGFGLIINSDGFHQRFSHNGGINGFSTALAWYPDDHLALVVLDNVANGNANQVMVRLADILFGRPVILPSERKEIAVDAKTLDRYVGRYQLEHGPVLTITREGDHLFAQADKQQKLEMYGEAGGDFFTTVVDSQTTFVAAGDAPASALILHQGNGTIKGSKLQEH